MSELLYLYGFVRQEEATPPPEVTGIEGRPVEILQLDGFSAALSRVPGSEYGEAVLQERSQDLPWMSQRAFLHERVVTWFVDRSGIVPARFMSLYRSEESLREEAAGRGAALRGLLRRMEGRREWDLKVLFDPERVRAGIGPRVPELARLDREIEESSPGRAYLMTRRRDDLAKERAVEEAVSMGRELVDALSKLAERVERVSPSGEAEGKGMAAQAAFLVDRAHEAEFQAFAEARATELAETGLDVRLTGPWAPYRFVSADGDPVAPPLQEEDSVAE